MENGIDFCIITRTGGEDNFTVYPYGKTEKKHLKCRCLLVMLLIVYLKWLWIQTLMAKLYKLLGKYVLFVS